MLLYIVHNIYKYVIIIQIKLGIMHDSFGEKNAKYPGMTLDANLRWKKEKRNQL